MRGLLLTVAALALPASASASSEIKAMTATSTVAPASSAATWMEYDEYAAGIAALHAEGKHALEPTAPGVETPQALEYDLASYVLNNDGGDFIASPGTWSGFGVSIGKPEWVLSHGNTSEVHRLSRFYEHGFVALDEPPSQFWRGGIVIDLSATGHTYRSTVWGSHLSRVELEPGQAAVLVQE